MLWDITQVYTEFKTELNCIVICHPPTKLKKRYSEGTILYIAKLLYGLAKTGNHWFAIYLGHHKEKLGIEILSYDIYLLIIKNGRKNFGIARLQTDNIFNVRTEAFMNKEETKIIEFKFKTKSQTILESGISGDFNGCHMTIKVEFNIVVQKNQVEKLVPVDIKDSIKKQ